MDFLVSVMLSSVSAITVFILDTIDIYTEAKRIDFLTVGTFWVYFIARSVFTLATLGVMIALNLVNVTNLFILAVLVPLAFVTLLQNLIVHIGGERGVNLGDVFTKFRRVAIDGLFDHARSMRAKLTIDLFQSNLSDDTLKNECLALSTPDDVQNLEKAAKALADPKSKRLYYVGAIVNWGTTQHAKQILSKQNR